jgi:intein-encoded DNA endonuclease-like protein
MAAATMRDTECAAMETLKQIKKRLEKCRGLKYHPTQRDTIIQYCKNTKDLEGQHACELATKFRHINVRTIYFALF